MKVSGQLPVGRGLRRDSAAAPARSSGVMPMMAPVSGSLRNGLLVAGSAIAIIVTGCGGGKSSSSTASSTASSTSPAASGTPGRGIALSSPEAHASVVSAISRTPNVPHGQDDRIASCAIAKLQAEHYTTVDQVPSAAATEAGRSCAAQALGGIDSPVTRQVLLDRIRKIPNVNRAQAGKITDCAISRFRAHGYASIDKVPQAVATRAGQDCAQQVVRR